MQNGVIHQTVEIIKPLEARCNIIQEILFFLKVCWNPYRNKVLHLVTWIFKIKIYILIWMVPSWKEQLRVTNQTSSAYEKNILMK